MLRFLPGPKLIPINIEHTKDRLGVLVRTNLPRVPSGFRDNSYISLFLSIYPFLFCGNVILLILFPCGSPCPHRLPPLGSHYAWRNCH